MSKTKHYFFSFIDALIGPIALQGVIIWTARNSPVDDMFLYYYIVAGFSLLQAVVDSGFSSSIIRDDLIIREKLDTVFFITILITIISLLLFFVFLGFDIPDFRQKYSIILVMCCGFLAYNIGLVPKAILMKRKDFKIIAGVTTLGSISGLSLYILVLSFFDSFFALSIMYLWRNLYSSVAYFFKAKYTPNRRYFDICSIKEYLKFSRDLTFSNALNNLYEFLSLIFIKRVFGESRAGIFTQMDNLKNFISINFVALLNRAFFVDLTSLKNNKIEMKRVYEIVLINAIYIIGFVSSFIFVFSDFLVINIYGVSYAEGSNFLRVFMLISLVFPLHAFQTLLYQVYGDSKRFLKLEIVKKCMFIPLYLFGYFLSMLNFSIGFLVLSIVMLLLYDVKNFKILSFSMYGQVSFVCPAFLLCILNIIVLYLIKSFLLVGLNIFFFFILHILFYTILTKFLFSKVYTQTLLLYYQKLKVLHWKIQN